MGTVTALPIRTAPAADAIGFTAAADAWVATHAAAGAWSKGTAPKYRQTMTGLAWQLPAGYRLVDLDGPAGPAELGAAYAAAFGELAPATRLRHLAALRSAVGWWRECGWLTGDPTRGWAAPRVDVDTTRALSRDQVAALWRLDVDLTDKTLWRMLYETAGRAEEVLQLDIGHLDLPNRRAKVIGKGGTVAWIFWQTGTAHLLPRLLAGRTAGPVFLANRRPTRATAAADICPTTGRARLSYRRAAERFEDATGPLAGGGHWTLHQLRHATLTHDAEDGTNTSLLLGRSRHASVRSLERYTRGISTAALARHVADRDPAARRNRPT